MRQRVVQMSFGNELALSDGTQPYETFIADNALNLSFVQGLGPESESTPLYFGG